MAYPMRKIVHCSVFAALAALAVSGFAADMVVVKMDNWFIPIQPSMVKPKFGEQDWKNSEADAAGRRLFKLETEIHALAEKGDYTAALEKLDKLEGLANKTENDEDFLYRTRFAIASRSGDHKAQIEAVRHILDKKLASDMEKPAFQAFLAGQYFLDKNYADAIAMAREAQRKGFEENAQKIVANSYILTHDYPAAATELSSLVEHSEQSHRRPSRDVLRMLINCNLKAGRHEAYVASMEKYLSYYADSGYWSELLTNLVTNVHFPARLNMDVYKLIYATGQLRQGELVNVAQRALDSGYAGFGAQLIEEGATAGVLEGGGDAKQAQALREKARQAADSELKLIAKEESQLGGDADPTMMAIVGCGYVDHGKPEKSIEYLSRAIASGGLKYPDQARLHLAAAYAKLGRKQAAIDTLEAIKGNDGTAQLAHYWSIYLKQAAVSSDIALNDM